MMGLSFQVCEMGSEMGSVMANLGYQFKREVQLGKREPLLRNFP